ncbi:cysteine peptidase family C39 domain-containing protein [Aliivibrio fischeri]|uniref:cysteine peptidase family C39 domain-containing protein n=1 Tax=Aliivibrio fischeri TaxID=668 RepID=UPI0012D8E9BB|nr:cysteine peptidase family C39 domain-containing protein [Aliivibrio fischeri]MUJ20630.1 hypothetical protein [Aliivibrio fischeri]
MNKLIKVPYVKQPRGTAKCGAACAAMIIKYYGSNKTDLDEIWGAISAISPEFGREYCRTFKIGDYLTKNHFDCVTVKYTSLKNLLEFCNINEIAPIVNHKSFEDRRSGHFSVIKNISDGNIFINDPENKKRLSVLLSELEIMAIRENNQDEVGGNTAIIPIFDKFESTSQKCTSCNEVINTSFTNAINTVYGQRIVESDLCQSCDVFNFVE